MNTVVHPIKVGHLAFKNYCYLIASTKTHHAVLVDPAWEIEKIEMAILRHGVQLAGILLTHHHHDHVNLAEVLARKYDVPVHMSSTEITYYGFNCHNLSPVLSSDTISYSDIAIRCILTPGHTKGALCYWIENALFSGDTLFIEGCGACIYKGGDPQEMFKSLSYLKAHIPYQTLIFPGHSFGEKPGHTFSYVLKNNFYLQIPDLDNFIKFRMRPNQSKLLAFE